jgi:hypothetical protein
MKGKLDLHLKSMHQINAKTQVILSKSTKILNLIHEMTPKGHSCKIECGKFLENIESRICEAKSEKDLVK